MKSLLTVIAVVSLATLGATGCCASHKKCPVATACSGKNVCPVTKKCCKKAPDSSCCSAKKAPAQ